MRLAVKKDLVIGIAIEGLISQECNQYVKV